MDKYEIEILASNLESYLQSQGINTNRLFRCINPDHRDENASMKFFDNHVYCFGCGARYNLFDAISAIEGLSSKDAFKKAIEYYGRNTCVPNKAIKEKPKTANVVRNYEKAFKMWSDKLKENQPALDYLKGRGISQEVIDKFKIGYNVFHFNQREFKSVIIPISKNCYTARNIDTSINELRYYKPKGCHIDLFNTDALRNEEKYCVITEGEFDCLSFQTIGINSMALSSVNNVNKFINENKDNEKLYILALDNDKAGNDATNFLKNYLEENNMKYCLFDNCGYKDANEALTSDKELFEQNIYGKINSELTHKKTEIELE